MSERIKKISYDSDVDALYLSLSVDDASIAHTDSFAIEDYLEFGDINIDFNESKKVVGIEVLSASKIVSKLCIEGLKKYYPIKGLAAITNGEQIKDSEKEEVIKVKDDMNSKLCIVFAASDSSSANKKSIGMEDGYMDPNNSWIVFNKAREIIQIII